MDYSKHYYSAKNIVEGIRSGRLRKAPRRPENVPVGGFMSRDVREDPFDDEPTLAEMIIDEMEALDSVLAERSTTGALSVDVSSVEEMDTRELLARTLFAEAGGEGVEGMLAAGSTIMNRVGRYGDDIPSVILKDGQFSAWNSYTGYANGEGGLDMLGLTPSEESYRVANQLLSGNYIDPTDGATHYYNDQVAKPSWGKSGNWKRIGNHLFGNPDG